jgi:hypothetical protein
MAAYDREQEWSSSGENSDGGLPLPPSVPGLKKDGQNSRSMNRAKISNPWEPSTHISYQPSRIVSWGASAAGERTIASPQTLGTRTSSRNGSWGGSKLLDTSHSHTANQDDEKLAESMN